MKPSEQEARAFLRQLEQQAKSSVMPSSASRRSSFLASDWNGPGGYRAGQTGRLTEGWEPGNVGPNQALRSGGARMRQRARDLVLNNPFAASAIDAYVANVIQQGVTPKPKIKDRSVRQQFVAAWDRWGGVSPHATREADITGQSTIYELQALWLTEIIVGGGCLVRYRELPRKGRSIPLAIEMFPEERFADDLMQSTTNGKTANPVVNGCEVDVATGRVVAYWIRGVSNMGDSIVESLDPVRVPREQCEYSYFKKRIGQLRGATLMHAALVWLHAIGYYTDSELVASNAKSQFAYAVTTDPDGEYDWNRISDDCDVGTYDYYGNPIESLQQGTVVRMAPGDKIQGIGPNVPGSDSNAWIELIIRSISIGSGLSYEELMRDYSRGSFSSVRAAMNSDRIRFRRISSFVENHFNNPAYPRFVDSAVREGLDGFPTAEEYIGTRDQVIAVGWEGPSWESVNPSDDAKADDIKIRNGTKLRSACVPGDIDDHFDNLEQEYRTIQEKGLDFGDPSTADAGSTDAQLTGKDQPAQKRKTKPVAKRSAR